MKTSALLEKAAIQALCDYMGYEEGKVYFSILNKAKVTEDYSHSKSYRILKSLFNLGVLAKIKDNKDLSTYIPLPPTFLIKTADPAIVDYLEKNYLKNHLHNFEKQIIELSLIGNMNDSTILFLLKYLMKDYAIVMSGGGMDYTSYKTYLDKDKLSKISYLCREDYVKGNPERIIKIKSSQISNRRFALIDGNLVIELLKMPNRDSYNHPESTIYKGYLVTRGFKIKVPNGEMDYIEEFIKDLKEFLTFNKAGLDLKF